MSIASAPVLAAAIPRSPPPDFSEVVISHLLVKELEGLKESRITMQAPSLSTQSSLRVPSPSEGHPPMPLLVQLSPHEELSFQQSPGGGGELLARISVKNIAGRPIAYKVSTVK